MAKIPDPFMTDDDSPEWTVADFAESSPFAEVFPQLAASLNKGGRPRLERADLGPAMFYKLHEREPVPCQTGHEWADWYESAVKSGARIVAHDELDDSFAVSTIFTGLDLNAIDADDPPQLFETMAFIHGKASGVAIRAATWAEAERQHASMVRQMRKSAVKFPELDG